MACPHGWNRSISAQDLDCYARRYPDLQELSSDKLWTHWVNFGKQEGRTMGCTGPQQRPECPELHGGVALISGPARGNRPRRSHPAPPRCRRRARLDQEPGADGKVLWRQHSGCRVAVMVSGSLLRYFLTSTMTKVVKPLAAQGHSVDYYVALSTGSHTPWRTAAYMSHLTWDPSFGPPSQAIPNASHVRARIVSAFTAALGKAKSSQGRLVRTDIFEQMPLDDDVRLQALRQAARAKQPTADPDMAFPIVSNGKGSKGDANRNFLRLYRALEQLWVQGVLPAERTGGEYDYVLILRDDARWTKPFNLNRLVHRYGAGDVYILSCDDRTPRGGPPMLPSEINDHVQLFVRERADFFGRFYSTLLHTDVQACQVTQQMKGGGTRQRRCMSEELLKWFLQRENVSVVRVNQQDLPLQRSAHVVVAEQASGESVIECGHKYCNSKCGYNDHKPRSMCTAGLITTLLIPAGYGVACSASTATAVLPEREAVARVETRTFALPRVAIYTVVTGAYEAKVPYSCTEAYGRGTPIAQSFTVGCYFVTDSEDMAHNASRMGWSAVRLRTSEDPKRQQRETKILGFDQAELAVLKTYEYVLYHDGHRGPRVHRGYPAEAWRCWLHKAISETLQPLLEQRADIVYFAHPDRKTTREEAEEVRAMKLCSNASLDKVAQLHKTHGYPDKMGLAETAVLARRWNSPTLQLAMHEWWDAMAQNGCMRDQLNFEFALWKHKKKVKYVRKEVLDFPFVKIHKHSDPHNIRQRLTKEKASASAMSFPVVKIHKHRELAERRL